LASQNLKANEKEVNSVDSSGSKSHEKTSVTDFYRVLPEPRKALTAMKEELMMSSSQSNAMILSFSLSLLLFMFKKNAFQVFLLFFVCSSWRVVKFM
jgi:hypothetical protein